MICLANFQDLHSRFKKNGGFQLLI